MSRTAAPTPVFACLADEQRLAVLHLVSAADGISASALATQLPVTRQAVSKHLTVLAAAGLITQRRRGREVVFRVEPGPLRDTADWLQRRAAEWDHQLDLVKQAAEDGLAGGGTDR